MGSIQANCAVPRRRRLYYYEITVKDAGDRGCIAIGFAPPDYKPGRQPGSVPGLNHAITYAVLVAEPNAGTHDHSCMLLMGLTGVMPEIA